MQLRSPSTSNGGRICSPTASLIGVVDDDESVRDALSSLIRSAGYRCVTFPSAEAFLASRQLHFTDCNVLDDCMPGMSGLELQFRLRQMHCTIPIIFLTAHADDSVRSQAMAQGAVAFLIKPCDDDLLLRAIRCAISPHAN